MLIRWIRKLFKLQTTKRFIVFYIKDGQAHSLSIRVTSVNPYMNREEVEDYLKGKITNFIQVKKWQDDKYNQTNF